MGEVYIYGCVQDCRGTGAGVCGQSVDRRLSISLGKHATVFHAEVLVYTILDCVHEIETQDRPEKYICICSDNQATLKALQAAKTSSLLLRQCQKVLKVISTRHTGHAGLRGN